MANGDVHIGNLVTQAVEKVGKEGVITEGGSEYLFYGGHIGYCPSKLTQTISRITSELPRPSQVSTKMAFAQLNELNDKKFVCLSIVQ